MKPNFYIPLLIFWGGIHPIFFKNTEVLIENHTSQTLTVTFHYYEDDLWKRFINWKADSGTWKSVRTMSVAPGDVKRIGVLQGILNPWIYVHAESITKESCGNVHFGETCGEKLVASNFGFFINTYSFGLFENEMKSKSTGLWYLPTSLSPPAKK